VRSGSRRNAPMTFATWGDATRPINARQENAWGRLEDGRFRTVVTFSRGKTRALGVGAVLASIIAAHAHASPSAKLTYVRGLGAEACPDEEELRRAVAARLGYDPFFPAASKTVVAEIRAARGGFRAEVKIIDAQGILRGQRTLETSSADCAEMVRALALGISIAIDDLDLEPTPTPAPSPTPTPTPTPAPTPAPSPTPTPAPSVDAPPSEPPRTSPRIEAIAGAHGTFGLAPALAGGVTLGVGLVWPRTSLRLEGTADLPASASIDTGGRVSSSFVVGSLVPCLHGAVPFACATLSLGSFRGEGLGIASPHADSAFFATAGVRGGGILALGDTFALVPHADVIIPLMRHRIDVNGRAVFALDAVGAALGMDVRALLP